MSLNEIYNKMPETPSTLEAVDAELKRLRDERSGCGRDGLQGIYCQSIERKIIDLEKQRGDIIKNQIRNERQRADEAARADAERKDLEKAVADEDGGGRVFADIREKLKVLAADVARLNPIDREKIKADREAFEREMAALMNEGGEQ